MLIRVVCGIILALEINWENTKEVNTFSSISTISSPDPTVVCFSARW